MMWAVGRLTFSSLKCMTIMLLAIPSQSAPLTGRRLEFLKDYSVFVSDPRADPSFGAPADVSWSVPPPPVDVIQVPIWPIGATDSRGKGKGKGGSRGTKGGSKGVPKGKGGGSLPLPIPPLPPPPPGKGKGSSKFPLPMPPKENCPPASPPFPIPTLAPVAAPTLQNPAGQPVFIIAPPSASANTAEPTLIDTRQPSGGTTSEPTIVNNSPTAGQVTITIFNSFIIGNKVGLVAADLVVSGTEPGASNALALEEGYTAFVAAEVEDYAATLSRRSLKRFERDLTTKRTVTLKEGSAVISQIGDVACPSYYLGDCQVVCASFDVLSMGIDAATIEEDLLIQTQKDILNLNEEMRAADPNVFIEVLRASFPVQPCLATPTTVPPAPTPALSPVVAPAGAPSRAPLPNGMTNPPTGQFTDAPSAGPTSQPTERPSASPSLSSSTSATPTIQPTERPSFAPSTTTNVPTGLTGTPSTAVPSASTPTPSTTTTGPSTSVPSRTSLPTLPPAATALPTAGASSPTSLPSSGGSAPPFAGTLGPTVVASPSSSLVPSNVDTFPPPTTANINTQFPSTVTPSVSRPPASTGTQVPSVSAAPTGPTASPAPTSLVTTAPTVPAQPSSTTAPTALDTNAPDAAVLPTTSPQPTPIPVPTLTASPSIAIATVLPTQSAAPSSSGSPVVTAGLLQKSDEPGTSVKVGLGLASAAAASLLAMGAAMHLYGKRKSASDKLGAALGSMTTDGYSSQELTSSFGDEENDDHQSQCSSSSSNSRRSGLETVVLGRGTPLVLPATATIDSELEQTSPFLCDVNDEVCPERNTSVLSSIFTFATESARLLNRSDTDERLE